MARSLVDPATGAPLAASALVTSASPPPLELPHLVVSTPAALLHFLDNDGPAFGFEWTRAGGSLAVVLCGHASVAFARPCYHPSAALRPSPLAAPPAAAASCWASGAEARHIVLYTQNNLHRSQHLSSVLRCAALPAAGLPQWVRSVVFDEADLLLAGAYERPIRIIMDVSSSSMRCRAA